MQVEAVSVVVDRADGDQTPLDEPAGLHDPFDRIYGVLPWRLDAAAYRRRRGVCAPARDARPAARTDQTAPLQRRTP